MIGIAIPAHNEAELLPQCLAAVAHAAQAVAAAGEPVQTVLVLDACTDASAEVAAAFGVTTIAIEARNVGAARACAADHLLALGARWLAFTDADTVVSPDWLQCQLALGVDAVCGTVCVQDWSPHGPQAQAVARHFAGRYRDGDGHRHVHGANFGVSAQAYLHAGGFAPLACSEDVALVEALQARGASIAWSAAPRVTTSARVRTRAAGGFGDTLVQWAGELGLPTLQAAAPLAPLAGGAHGLA